MQPRCSRSVDLHTLSPPPPSIPAARREMPFAGMPLRTRQRIVRLHHEKAQGTRSPSLGTAGERDADAKGGAANTPSRRYPCRYRGRYRGALNSTLRRCAVRWPWAGAAARGKGMQPAAEAFLPTSGPGRRHMRGLARAGRRRGVRPALRRPGAGPDAIGRAAAAALLGGQVPVVCVLLALDGLLEALPLPERPHVQAHASPAAASAPDARLPERIVRKPR